MKRLWPLLLPIVSMLAGCGEFTQNLAAADPCYEFHYHSFDARDPWSTNNRTTALTSMMRPDAPPGCFVQTSNNYSDGIGVDAVKTVAPAAIMGGALVGYGAVLRPPQYNSSTNVTGANFGSGAVAGGSAASRAAGGRIGFAPGSVVANGGRGGAGGSVGFAPNSIVANGGNGYGGAGGNAFSSSSASAAASARQHQGQGQDQSQWQQVQGQGGGVPTQGVDPSQWSN